MNPSAANVLESISVLRSVLQHKTAKLCGCSDCSRAEPTALTIRQKLGFSLIDSRRAPAGRGSKLRIDGNRPEPATLVVGGAGSGALYPHASIARQALSQPAHTRAITVGSAGALMSEQMML